MNVLKLLKKDHAMVRSLFAKFDNARKNAYDRKQELFYEIRRELSLHTQTEEEIFYPAIKAIDGDARKLVSEAVQEHRDADELIMQIVKLRPQDKAFSEKMEALMETVDHHIEEEEGEIFRFAEENCPEEQLERMADDIQRRKKTIEQRWAA